MMAGQPQKISLGDDFGDVVVDVNGVSVEIHADGSILAPTKERHRAAPPVNDDSPPDIAARPTIGQKMPDGTIYAGTSPLTGKAMYTMPADASSLTCAFNEAQQCVRDLNSKNAHSHKDWRLPSKEELNVLFNNRAAIGGF